MNRCYILSDTQSKRVSAGDFKSSNKECIISASAATLRHDRSRCHDVPNVVTTRLHSVIAPAQIYALLAICTFTSLAQQAESVVLHSVRDAAAPAAPTHLRENNSGRERKFHRVRSMRSIITSLAHSLLYSFKLLPRATVNGSDSLSTNYTFMC